LPKIDATTEDDIQRHMREDGYDPDEPLNDQDIISPAIIRKRLGLLAREPEAVLRTPMNPA
jgi:putative transcriptional regulator